MDAERKTTAAPSEPSRAPQADDPKQWSLGRKWTILVLVSAMSMLANFATMTIIPAVPLVLQEFQPPSVLYTTLLVSIWELGEGLGPFAIGPLAELCGRLPVLHVGNVVYMLAMVGAGMSTSASMLVAFRFLAALFVTPLTLAPTIVADLFRPEERGAAMALTMALPLLAPPGAPIVGGFISASLGWRWTVWIVLLPSAAVALLLLLSYRETHQPSISRRRAKQHRDRSAPEDGPSSRQSASRAFLRPLYLFLYAPSVSIPTVYMAVVYGMVYLVLTTLTEMLQSVYHFQSSVVGLGFLGIAIGMLVAGMVYGLFSDRYLRYRARSRGEGTPEDRLPFLLLGAGCLPPGFVLYGWTAEYRVHWIAPIMATSLLGFSLMMVQIPTENYLTDAFEDYSATAISIVVILRALTGAVLPLAGPSLYQKLGYGWGNTLLGLLGLLFVPILVLLLFNGGRMRNSSRLAELIHSGAQG